MAVGMISLQSAMIIAGTALNNVTDPYPTKKKNIYRKSTKMSHFIHSKIFEEEKPIPVT
jgi:hypothetical protein